MTESLYDHEGNIKAFDEAGSLFYTAWCKCGWPAEPRRCGPGPQGAEAAAEEATADLDRHMNEVIVRLTPAPEDAGRAAG